MHFGKKTLTVLIMAFFMVAALATLASAGTLTLVNKSASDIHAIYISDSNSNDWEENILEGYMLPSGNQVDIQIEGSYNSFDLRVEDEDGSYEDYSGYPGHTSQIVLHGGGRSEFQ